MNNTFCITSLPQEDAFFIKGKDVLALRLAEFAASHETAEFQKTAARMMLTAMARLEEGHAATPLDTLYDKKFEMHSGAYFKAPSKKEIELWRQKGLTCGKDDELKPLTIENNLLYLHRYRYYEKTCAQKLKEISSRQVNQDSSTTSIFNALFPDEADGLSLQRTAALAALQKHFCVISGGPGTGKTATVGRILYLALAADKNLSIALAAPTGKAAARLKEALNDSITIIEKNLAAASLPADEEILLKLRDIQGQTVHRLLGRQGGSSSLFRFNESNVLPYSLLVLDEASMADIALVHSLLSALNADCRVIFLGDRHQLASVEAGAFFADICEAADTKDSSITGAAVTLKTSYRFRNHPGIGSLAELAKCGEQKFESWQKVCAEHENEVKLIINSGEKETYAVCGTRAVSFFENYISQTDPLEKLNSFLQFKVLSALRSGSFGIKKLNSVIEEALCKAGLIHIQTEFYENRPVMITVNDYDTGLFNGDCGIICGGMAVFPGKAAGEVRKFHPSQLPSHETVFAMTVHKSQGSEFDHILFVLPAADSKILTRELIYTGITRAKKSVTLLCQPDVLSHAAAKTVSRGSGLKQRF